ncbi:RPA12-like protein [Mya arenaria]|uniref:DNA-directed RNA polymerase subunit n=1 Tax=Mya arenaria TaxID=6604 RepID=A0ABY7GES4_MYAAR|nr:DNA-directed RNA polymerase I subunit RPA12-like [Mya arenaria]XP_052790943.1 DNA-directed RNA polymerase I subunit RPA12-like [Mya arenaria]WAR31755.1 RPA12-like protein [Mya arenaria]WAR31857.1 RPA12-like protein [Mya arenaria]
MSGRKEVFSSELDFCPRCGTVLPLPEVEDVVMCALCSFKIDVKDFDGIEVRTKAEFNRPETMLGKEEEADSQLKGPMADRKCSKCEHDGMIYTTRQTRSADEGQTVFFTCPECRFQEIEYS